MAAMNARIDAGQSAATAGMVPCSGMVCLANAVGKAAWIVAGAGKTPSESEIRQDADGGRADGRVRA